MNQEELMEYIGEVVEEKWQLPNRPDLREDCINYIWEHWNDEGEKENVSRFNYEQEVFLVKQMLSYHCREAVSSQDIEYMALAEKERLLTMT